MTIWTTKTIGEFCQTGSGGTPSRQQESRFYGGGIPWIKSGELKESIVYETEETITEAALKETSTKMIPSGALLVAMYGATVGRVAILGITATSNQAVCHIIPDSTIADQRYMFYALRQQVPRWLEQRVGGAQPNISQQIIRNTPIPLPPLEEQRRIAAILDQADAVRRKRKEAIRLTEDLLRAAFLDMFGDPVTNPKGWDAGTILDVVKNPKTGIRCGPFGTQLKVHEIVPVGIPLYGIENVKGGRFQKNTDKHLTAQKAKELESFNVQPKDVLITRMGTIGHACVVPEGIGEARISYHLFRIRPDSTKCLPGFLASTITWSGTFLAQLEKLAHGAIMSGLKTNDLKEVQFLIPPIELQQKYLDIVSKTEISLKRHLESKAYEENLFNSLLQRAFRGEL